MRHIHFFSYRSVTLSIVLGSEETTCTTRTESYM